MRIGGGIEWLSCPSQIRRCHHVSVTHSGHVLERLTRRPLPDSLPYSLIL